MSRAGEWIAATALVVVSAVASAQAPSPEIFRNPPAEVRPRTLYFWMNGNVTRAGLDADLGAIHDAGLGGLLMFDGSTDVPKGPVDYLSPRWLDLVDHMISKADSLGLKVGIENAPGWSSSGGPWIKPAQAMQQIVWTETTVTGGKPLILKLARPYTKENYYRDAFVLAYPASKGDESFYRNAIAGMRTKVRLSAQILTDRDLHTAVDVSPEAPLVVTMKVPFTARALTIYGEKETPAFSATVEASNDGRSWIGIGKVSVGAERGIESPGTLDFDATTAREFRITPSAKVKIAEALFYATPRIPEWDLKTENDFAMTRPAEHRPIGLAGRDAIDPAKIIDISSKVDGAGVLRWSPPKGRWTVLRLGYTPTGKRNVSASGAGRGLEVDKLSSSAVDYQFDHTVGRVAKAAGPLAGKTFDRIEIDSYEVGLQNWTATLPTDFATRNHYDIRPYLPALTGRIVGDLDTSNRFLFDFRRTLAELMADNYYGRMQQRANEAGLKIMIEGYGPGPFDELQVSGRAQVPMTEFWTRTPWTDNRSVKMVSSAAHVYGKTIVSAESFTGEPQTSRWEDYPYALKTLGDQMFAQGVNQIFFHRDAHQPNPSPNVVPGMVMGPWGMNLDRTNTWFAQARPWMDYLARSQYLLQQGTYVADVLYFVGEQSPNEAEYVRPDVSPDTNPLIGQYFSPQVPPGYSYDLVNAEVLLTRARVKDGRIVLPDGASYRLLVIPATLDSMTPRLAARIRQLVEQGMAVLGPKPSHPMTLAGKAGGDLEFKTATDALWGTGTGTAQRQVGKGRVFPAGSVADALAALQVAPDALCRTAAPNGQVVWLHRKLDGSDLYFVANRQRRAETVTCAFRVGDSEPSLWNAETGSVTRAAFFESGPDTTRVTFALSPAGSIFVMLKPANAVHGISWVARDGHRFIDMDAPQPGASAAPSDSFTISLWAKPDIDLRLMPQQSADGRVDETGKNYVIPARSGEEIHGPGTAVAGLALGRNGAFVIERASPEVAPAVLVSHAPVAGWTHVALVYDKGTPKLYLNGKLVGTGVKTGRKVFAGGGDPPSPRGVTYFFEGNSTPLRIVAGASTATEIAAQAAAGPPAPSLSPVPAWLTRRADGKLHALVWQSGRYTTSRGSAFSAAVPTPLTIAGPWAVHFEAGRGAPDKIVLPSLESLSHNADSGVRHFSGTATYERTITVPRGLLKSGRRVFLDLGRVEVLAGVTVNGRDLGVAWKAPYRVDITNVVHLGDNNVSLAVTDLWANRMIADAALPEEGSYVDADWPIGERFSADGKKTGDIMARKITALPAWYTAGAPKPPGGRVTFTPWLFYSKDEPLLDSGLLGPVRIVFADEVTAK